MPVAMANFGVLGSSLWPDEVGKNMRMVVKASRRYQAILILIFGLAYALLIPPFQSPDEPNHFFRAWQVSEGHFFPEKIGNRLGGVLPASLSQVSDSLLFLKNNPVVARLTHQRFLNALSIPLRPENRRFTDFANTAIYAPTAYFPQAAAIAILRPLGATPLQIFFGVRISNLLIWFVLVSSALRLFPFFKNTFLAILLLPASLCIAASANADVSTNGLCWWLVAALVAAPNAAAFWRKLLTISVVAANKLIAIPLALSGLICSSDKSTRPANNYGPVAILLLSGMLAALFWGRLAQGWFIAYDAYDPAFRDTQTLNAGVNPARQMAFVLENPLFFVKMCSKSLVQAMPSMAAHFVGKFGWEKNYLPTGWLVLLWAMLAAMMLSEKNPLSARQRWGMGGVALLYLGAFALTMYALWSAVGAESMDNWQGRYFTPIAPVLVLALAQGWLKKWGRVIGIAAFIVLILSNLMMLSSIVEHYYW